MLLRCGITYIFLSEVRFDPTWLFLDAAQSSDGVAGQGEFVSCRSDLGHVLLQVGIEQLVGVQFRRITGQVKDLDLVLMFLEPLLHRLRVMNPEIVQDEEDPLLSSMHKPLHKADQYLGIQCSREDLPSHLALVGHGRNDTQLGAIGVGQHHGGLAFGSVATTAHVVGTQTRLIASLNLGAFLLGLGGDLRILLVHPLRDRFRRLLIGLLQWPLRRESPALQILAHVAHRQPNAIKSLDQLAHRLARPQRIAELQLVRCAVLNQLLNLLLLLGGQLPTAADRTAAPLDLDRTPATSPKSLVCLHYCVCGQLALLRNLAHRNTCLTQLNRPAPPLVQHRVG